MRAPRRFRALTIAFVVALLVFGPAACAGGDAGSRSTALPTTDATAELPSPGRSGTRNLPATSSAAESPRPTRSLGAERTTVPAGPETTGADAQETTAPGESAQPPLAVPPSGQGQTSAEPPAAAEMQSAVPQSTVTPSPASAPASGLLFVLVLIVAVLIAGALLIGRAQRRSAWDREAQQLGADTLAAAAARLPPVLNTTAADDRGMAWPPIRSGLVGLAGQWGVLAGRGPGEQRRNWALRVSGLLQDLIAAVDAESQGIAAGTSWQVFRPQVLEAHQALEAVLSVRPANGPTEPLAKS